jgi:hypothetical protein
MVKKAPIWSFVAGWLQGACRLTFISDSVPVKAAPDSSLPLRVVYGLALKTNAKTLKGPF